MSGAGAVLFPFRRFFKQGNYREGRHGMDGPYASAVWVVSVGHIQEVM